MSSSPARPSFLQLTAAVGLLLVAGLTLSASSQGKDLRLVSTVWPPFTNVAGQPRFALDLVEAGLDRSGVPSATTFVDNEKYTSAMTTGPFDGSGAAWRDAQREKALVYSQPYLENRLILIARLGGDVSARATSALKGRRLGVVEGYAYGEELERSGATLVRAKSQEDSLRQLLDGKVDYTLMDALVVQYILENYPEEAKTRLQIGTAPLITRSLHLAVRRSRPDAESIIQRFNLQLRAMITDRTYHRLLHVDWIRADADGDGIPEYIAGSDQPGKQPPQYAYPLFSAAEIEKQVKNQERYFFGGAIYNGWSSVPDHYKVDDLGRTDAQHPTARIFTFSWK
jgi:polar amino acid transport system substrate-binding protein